MPERDPIVYEFGPFRLDAAQRLLFRDEQLINLSPKALDTLLILVRHHGQLVEKDELIRQVWPRSVVEESNLAIQVSALRKVLGPAMTSDPIATIPKRGYRFVAEVRELARTPATMTAPATAQTAIEVAPPVPSATLPSTAAPRAAASRWGLLAGVLIAMFIGWRWYAAEHRAVSTARGVAAQVLSEKDSVLLADVQNETGEGVFDFTLRQALSIQLEQSPFLTLISDQQIQRALALMQQPRTARLTPQVAWELCERTGASAVIYPSIANLGEQYILGLRATDCHSGDSLANQQVSVQGRDHVLMAVDQAATALRRKLGESLGQVQQYNTPIEEATTASLSALEAYSQGWLMNYRKGDSAAALAFYQQAIAEDPNFAMAYAALGAAYSNEYEPGLAAQSLQRAYALRAHVSEREKYYIEARYQRLVTGDLEQARQANARWAQVYPHDAVPYTSLAVMDRYLGQYPRALQESQTALRLSPDSAQSYANLSFSYLLLNRFEDARQVVEQAQARHLDSPLLRHDQYFLAWFQNDRAAAAQLESWSVGQAGVEDRFLHDHALQYAYQGQLAQARVLIEQAIASAQHAGQKETAVGYRGDWAMIQALVGNVDDARKQAADVLRNAQDRDSRYEAAMALAMLGDEAAVRPIADALAKQYPDDTAVQSCYLPSLHAALAVSHRQSEQALQALDRTRPYELGEVTGLYPVYLRGQAYLLSKQSREALLEFQKLLDWHGAVLYETLGALTRLQVARAYAQDGQPAQARRSYQAFLSLWQQADPQVPVLKAARAELSRLPTP